MDCGCKGGVKKNVVRKQEMEIANQEIYSYMHDIFGAEVIDLFDMKYNPLEQHPKKASDNTTKTNDNSDKIIIREDE